MKMLFISMIFFVSNPSFSQILEKAARYTNYYSYDDDQNRFQVITSFGHYPVGAANDKHSYKILGQTVQITCSRCDESSAPFKDTAHTASFAQMQNIAPSLFPADFSKAIIEPSFLSKALGFNSFDFPTGELFSVIDENNGNTYLNIYSEVPTEYLDWKDSKVLPSKFTIPLGNQFSEKPTLDGYIYPQYLRLIRLKANHKTYLAFAPTFVSIDLIKWAKKQMILASLQRVLPEVLINKPSLDTWDLYYDQFSDSLCTDVKCFKDKYKTELKKFRDQAHFGEEVKFSLRDWNQKVIPALLSIGVQEQQFKKALLDAKTLSWKVADDLDHVALYTNSNTQPVLEFQSSKYIYGGLTYLFEDSQ